jgi:chaperonin GroEL (HSP60 family)
MKAKVEAIASHGINVFVNRQLIYNYPESILAEKSIMSIEHADFEGVERLSLVTGGEITSTFDRPELVKLGRCDLIEEIMIGEDKVEPCCDLLSYDHLTNDCSAHQILGRCGWRGMHGRVAWFY